MTDTATAAIEQLNAAWAEFKSTNDERIKSEAKGVADVLFDLKAAKINDAMDELSAKIKTMEAKAARPAAGADSEQAVEEFKAKVRNWASTGNADGRGPEIKALSIGTNADGGFAVPKVIDLAVEKLARDISPIRAISNVVSISTNDYNKLVNVNGTTSGWVAETATRTETSTPQLANIQIPPGELYVNAMATQPSLDDPLFDMEAWLMENIYEEFFRAEGAAFVSGNGTNRPTGFIATGTPVATADSARAFGQLQYIASGGAAALPTSADTYLDIVHALKAAYRTNATWVTNKAVLGAIRKLKDTANQYLWQPSVQAGTPAQFMGYAVVEAEDMPAVAANVFPLAFGDFRRGYLITDRKDVMMLRDPYSNKPYIGFYATKRVGGKVVNSEAIKLLKIAAS